MSRVMRLTVLGLLTVAFSGVLGVGPARAALPSNCAQSGTNVSCQFSFTGADQTFTVPVGISSVNVVAVGAPGGASGPRYPSPVPGGAGALARGTLNVRGGQTLYVEVGGPGDDGFYTSAGGFNGGGIGDHPNGVGGAGGGGGGGASDVRTAPSSAGLSPDPRLLVAGGGGGAGAPTRIGGGLPGDYLGGAGGAAGQPGASGELACFTGPGGGGGPGTATSGGGGGSGGTGGCEGGETPGQKGGDGALGLGGGGSTTTGAGGGGGGGGLYGGGQGGQAVFDPNDGLFDGAGGGGGGGSSRVPAGGSVTPDPAGLTQGAVTISYTVA